MKTKTKSTSTILLLAVVFLTTQCMNVSKKEANESQQSSPSAFEKDVNFLSNYVDVTVLEHPDGGKVAVSAALQGRVMTSTAGSNGTSYGWINYDLFKSKDTLDHINAFGGEERFWLGPEGGQFSLFFKKGDPFDLTHWQTPRLIDLDHFEQKNTTGSKARYSKTASITNYSGFEFQMDIDREIEVLSAARVSSVLGVDMPSDLARVGYVTRNKLTNTGEADWQKDTGLVSIWLLGMLNHSPKTVVVIPYQQGDEATLGPVVNDTYFGKVPADRLKVTGQAIFFKGDGQYRSKIGLSPQRSKDVLGSYDADNKRLTLLKFEKPEGVTDYVNSLWEIQDEPYAGDVINSYNDGAPEPGAKPLGPFYELETSSPALALSSGDSYEHVQYTFHFEGNEEQLDVIAQQVLGVSLDTIGKIF